MTELDLIAQLAKTLDRIFLILTILAIVSLLNLILLILNLIFGERRKDAQ